MRSATFLILAAFVSFSTCFQIPQGQTNGVYAVQLGPHGVERHVALQKEVEKPPKGQDMAPGHNVTLPSDRQIPGAYEDITCSGSGMRRKEFRGALTNLEDQCGEMAWVDGQRDFYAIDNCTVCFFCNFGDSSVVCDRTEVRAAIHEINAECGDWEGGWDGYFKYDTDPWGYGKATAEYGCDNFCQGGDNFCGRGTYDP